VGVVVVVVGGGGKRGHGVGAWRLDAVVVGDS